MFIRTAVLLGAVLCVAPISAAAAQEAARPERLVVPAVSGSASPAGPALHEPAVAPLLRRAEPTWAPIAPIRDAERSSVAADRGQHTIVVSTLALVLGAVLLVLLIR